MQPDCQPGDIVARRKWLVMHKGVVLDDGRILHNTPWRGEHASTLGEFRAGRRLRVTPTDRRTGRRVAGAVPHGARRYNLFTNNCEHTVNRATTGRATSPQLQGWIAGAGLAVVAIAVLRHPVAAATAFALGRGLVRKLRNGASRSRQS
ncbi:MAG: hypothetical protein OXP09_03560 [Gammaproteobacteria bacterium]|nr:hypothetical protein [Gammaproteobacteria bacterium]MDE0364629.1 hypothetical protein [Gammaproteobacteria bacterium]